MYTVRISVRNLVETVLRSGDIGSAAVLDIKRAEEGSRVHRLHQENRKKEEEEYKKEYYLKYRKEYEDILIDIDGRADGLVEGKYVEEIKSTYTDLDDLEEDRNKLHWGQVFFYAFMYLKEKNLNEIDVHLTYFNITTEKTRTFIKHESLESLEEYVNKVTDVYYEFVRLSHLWKRKRNKSIKDLEFPFEKYRPGQKEMAKNIYLTIKNERNIFVQAPTGIGKTISSLFPAVKALKEGLIDRIFYLTPKSTGKLIGEESVEIMRDRGTFLRSITLTSKEKICFMEEVKCEPEYCPFARGYYDRINQALADILKNENSLRREIIENYALKHNICPFEFSLELSLYSDIIIGDYNYAFDPRVYLKRFFDEKSEKYAFLVDESHNLVDRARDMFSAELKKNIFHDVSKFFKTKDKDITKRAKEVVKFFKNKEKELVLLGGDNTFSDPDENFVELIYKFQQAVEKYLNDEELEKKRDKNSDEEKLLLDCYFACLSFTRISEIYNIGYLTYFSCHEEDSIYKMFCIDTRINLMNAIKRADSTVFFSATLSPMEYYLDLYGASDEDYKMQLQSPFPKENLDVFVDMSVKTNYKMRDTGYEKIADDLILMLNRRKGNYIAFFPSYKYLESVYNVFTKKAENNYIINRQEQGLDEIQRVKVLDSFNQEYDKSMIYFMVLGGVFSEGIDLKGDKLIGSAVIGMGYPTLDYERELIMDYFEKKNNQGFNYAFTYPGINKVTQACGRVIRSENDTGMLLLIGDGYKRSDNQKLLPKDWFVLKDISILQDEILSDEILSNEYLSDE